MKKIFFTTWAICSFFLCHAQMSKDTLLARISRDICKSLDTVDLSKFKGGNMEMEMGMLMAPSLLKYGKDAQQVYGIQDMQTLFEKVGNDLGMELVMSCPKMMELAMTLAKDEGVRERIEKRKLKKAEAAAGNSDYDRGASSEKSQDILKYTPPLLTEDWSVSNGKLIAITQGDITTISIKETNGKTTKLYWLEYFENADDLSKNSKKYIGKNVIYKYEEKEVYNAATKKYKTIKIIKSIELD